MPRLEEVVIYIQGLWMLVTGREEGLRYLDLTPRGFWRSWWSIVWCIPPMLLNYQAIKWSIQSVHDSSVVIGNNFYPMMAVIDLSGTVAATLALFVITRLGGFGQHAMAIMTALNWLSVPLQWAFSADNLIELYVPGGDMLTGLTTVLYLATTAILSYRIINRIVGGSGLAATASVLTLFIVPMIAQMQAATMIGLVTQ